MTLTLNTIEWKKSKILSKDSNKFTRWIREAVHIQLGQERTMNCDMGQCKSSSTYIPILLDCKTAYTPSTASQRQSNEACSKQYAKAHKVKTDIWLWIDENRFKIQINNPTVVWKGDIHVCGAKLLPEKNSGSFNRSFFPMVKSMVKSFSPGKVLCNGPLVYGRLYVGIGKFGT